MATATYGDPPASNRDFVRLLTVDIDLSSTPPVVVDRKEWSVFFSDGEIDVFLALAVNNVWRASAIALRAIAVSKALLAKAFSIGDYSESATEIQVAETLNRKAEEFDELSKKYGGPYSSVQNFDYGSFSWRARTWRDAIVGD